MPIILLITAAIALVAYIAIIVAIWQRGYRQLAEADRGPATYRANLIGLVLYSALVGVIGLGALLIGGRPVMRLAESAGWPTAPGEVVESRVEPVTVSGMAGDIARWQPIITYTYEVDGQMYTNDAVTFREGHTFNAQAEAEAVTARYAPGQSVEVAYQPGDPQNAVLERRVPTESYLIAAGGLIVLALHLIGVIKRARLPVGQPYSGPFGW